MPNRKEIALLFAVLITIATLSGCIDIELAKTLLVPKKEGRVEYIVKEYVIKHTFVTVLTDQSTLTYSASKQVPVPNGSVMLDMIVRVVIAEFPNINESVSEIIENYTPDRYVCVSLYTPNGSLRYEETFNETTHHPLQTAVTKNPSPGNWTMCVNAQGIGIKAIDKYDKFEVRVRVKQPVGGLSS